MSNETKTVAPKVIYKKVRLSRASWALIRLALKGKMEASKGEVSERVYALVLRELDSEIGN